MRIRNILAALAAAGVTVLCGGHVAAAEDGPFGAVSAEGTSNAVAHYTAAFTDPFTSLQEAVDSMPR